MSANSTPNVQWVTKLTIHESWVAGTVTSVVSRSEKGANHRMEPAMESRRQWRSAAALTTSPTCAHVLFSVIAMPNELADSPASQKSGQCGGKAWWCTDESTP